MAVNGRALTAVCVGSLFVWSGIRGWSILATAGDLITGHAPTQSEATPLTAPGDSPVTPGATAAASDIASTAVQYAGHAYEFGGAPGKDGSHPWDCSSFVNWIVGVKLGLAIPGIGPGQYDGSFHGPPTGMWGVWSGLTHVSRADVQAGDLIVWVGHMGVAISNAEMISALNSQAGTKVTPIDGYGNGPILCYGRYGRVAHNNVKAN